MMKTIIPLASLIFLLCTSCQDDVAPAMLVEGTYTGTFGRSSPNAKYESSEVELVLENGRFRGSSSKMKYPAICEGTYTVSGNEVQFNDLCVWTAEFDWSLILSGKFELSVEGDEYLLTKSYGGGTFDHYRLRRSL